MSIRRRSYQNEFEKSLVINRVCAELDRPLDKSTRKVTSKRGDFFYRVPQYILDVIMIALLLLMALMCFSIMSSCYSGSAQKGNATHDGAENTSHHFRNFEVEFPSGWYGSGNNSLFLRNDNYEDAYIIVSPLRNESPEDGIKKNLELFESSKFYKNQISFDYDEKTEFTSGSITGNKVSGTLNNLRTNSSYKCYGYFLGAPASYVVAVYANGKDEADIKAVVDDAISNFKNLESS